MPTRFDRNSNRPANTLRGPADVPHSPPIQGDGSNPVGSTDSVVGPSLGDLDSPGLPASGGLSSRATGRPRPRVSERTRVAGRDRGRFDNGTHRYDWDLRHDERGDVSGEIGGGYRRGPSDVYVGSRLDEASGRIDATARGAHDFSNGVTIHGSLGGRLHDGAAVNPSLNRGELGGHYDGEGALSAEGAIGSDPLRGDYARGELTNAPNSRRRERISAEYSERNGFRGDFEGRHRGNGWSLEETLRIRGSDVSGELSANGSKRLGDNTSLTGRARVSTNGTYDLNSIVEHGLTEDINLRARVSASNTRRAARLEADVNGLNGTHRGSVSMAEHRSSDGVALHRRGEVRYDLPLDMRVNTSLSVGADTRGERHIESRAEMRAESGTTFRGRGRIEHADGRGLGATLSGEAVNGNNRIEARLSVRDGSNIGLSATGRRDLGEGRSLDVGTRLSSAGNGAVEGELNYHYRGDAGVSTHGRVGRSANGWEIAGGVERTHSAGSESVSVGYGESGGLRGDVGATRRFGENNDTSVGGNLRASSAGVDGEVRADTVVGEEDEVNVGGRVFAASSEGRLGLDVKASRAAEKDRLGVNGRVSLERDVDGIALGGDGGTVVKNLMGSSVGGRFGVGGGLELNRIKELEISSDWRGDVRRAVILEASNDSQFITFGGASYLSANAGLRVPMGPGYVDVGYKLGRRIEIEHIRLTDAPRLGSMPSTSGLFSGTDADSILGLRTGEGLKLKGETTHGVTGAAGLGGGTSSGSGVDANVKVGVTGSVTLSGRTSTEVVRGEGTSARLVVSAADSREIAGGIEARVGISPDADTLINKAGINNPRGAGPAAEVAKSIVENGLRSALSMRFIAGPEGVIEDSRLVDARLDLSHSAVRDAYDAALDGDWSDLESLHRARHAGVEIERSVFTELVEKGLPISVAGLGLSASTDDRETIRDSEVILNDENYEVLSDHDLNLRSVSGWFGGGSVRVEDYSRTITPTDGASMDGVKAVENWLSWSGEATDSFTSKGELLANLNLASFVAEGEQEVQLEDYRAKIAGLPEHRKLWVGPRNELRKTTVKTRVRVSDVGMDRVSQLASGDVWAAYVKAFQATDTTGQELPRWFDPSRRVVLESIHESVRPLDYVLASSFVTQIVEASQVEDETTRNDLIREAIATRGLHSDSVLMATVVELIGRDYVEMTVEVTSNADSDSGEYGLSFTHRGAEFDVVTTAFGETL